jgi:CRP-like cAMP-binding protein
MAIPLRASNRILSALSDVDYRRITAKAEAVSLQVGVHLYEPDTPIPSMYFMNSGICSIVTNMDDGGSVEVMIVGREGIVGLPALESDSATTTTQAFMQIDGDGMKIDAAVIRQEFSFPGTLQFLLLRLMQFQMTQLSQTAACNRLHDLEERLSRWLLMVHDRVLADTFYLTHEFLAQMLGTRRSSVTLAAGVLQRAGLIDYKHGQIHISNRAALEGVACQCYPIVKTSFDRFLKN